MAAARKRATRKNSPLVIVSGNPPRRVKPERVSGNVVAIIYVRDDNKGRYIHGFGDADIHIADVKGGVLIKGLKSRTRVAADALPDGSWHLYNLDGKSLHQEFPDGSA